MSAVWRLGACTTPAARAAAEQLVERLAGAWCFAWVEPADASCPVARRACLLEALAEDRVDVVVMPLTDVPAPPPARVHVACVPRRTPPTDAWFVRSASSDRDIPSATSVATDHAWRVACLRALPTPPAVIAQHLDATAALAHADGAIIALAHPGWWISRHQYDPRMWMDRDALRRGGIAEGLDALELWNGVYPRYTEALLRDWVDLWEAGNEVPIVGNSDFHRRAQHHLGTPRTFVLCPVPPGGAPSLDRACVLDAARRGRSYLSQGPAIAWSANGRIAGERIVAAPGELIRLTVEVKLRDALGEPLLEVLRGNEVVETRPLPNLHTRHEVRVTMPDHDTPLWLRVAYGTYDYSTPPFALVTNPITLDVPPARTDTREAAGGSLARRRYALGAESRSHWAADRWVRDRLQALVLQDRSGRIQRVGARRRIARAR